MKLVATLCLFILIYWMYFNNRSKVEDYNVESMDVPLTLGLMLKNQPAVVENYYREDNAGAFAYPNKKSRFEHHSLGMPMLTTCYIPFIKLYGVGNKALAMHSLFFTLLAFALTGWIAYKIYGFWSAIISVGFLLSSLSWMIHSYNSVMHSFVGVCIMMGLVLMVLYYNKFGLPSLTTPWMQCIIGALLGMAFLTSWIVFPFCCIFTFWTVFYADRMRWITVSFLAFIILFVTAYAASFGLSDAGIWGTIISCFTSRFTEGQNPAIQVALWQKPLYAFKWLFWDMQCFDHPDKYLEGYPAIPLVFTAFFFIGFFNLGNLNIDKVSRQWFLSVFLVLITIYLYANRYMIVTLPAMALIASYGVFVLYAKFKGSLYYVWIAGALILGSIITTRHQFDKFIWAKPQNFEVDRMRGHTALYTWIKSVADPKDTMIILGDSINLNAVPLIFHTFENPYRFMMYTNYEWGTKFQEENLKLRGFKKAIFIFSTMLLSDGKTTFNDPTPFLKLHPEIKPDFDYCYQWRDPHIYGYIINL